jgi:hypothetical protein
MSDPLTTASQIGGLISVCFVIGGGALALWRCQAFGRAVVRIAEGHARPEDVVNVEEGLATSPALRDAARAAQRRLEHHGHPEAAQRLRQIQIGARNRATNQGDGSPGSPDLELRSIRVEQPPIEPGRPLVSARPLQTARSAPSAISVEPIRRLQPSSSLDSVHTIGRPSKERSEEQGVRPRRGVPSTKGAHTGGTSRIVSRRALHDDKI